MWRRENRGFTLVELVIVIVILGVLAAAAVPRFVNLGRDARIAAVNGLGGAVRTASSLAHTRALVSNNLGNAGWTVFVEMDGVSVRIWNGWPDRWWDGIGITLLDATPTSGGYLSTAAYPYNKFVFYGYGNTRLPGGLAGWLIPDAPTPRDCSVAYNNNGSGAVPVVTVTTSGC